MRVLLDTCVWGKAAEDLRASGHDVVSCGDWAEDPGDSEILARALAAGRVLVTLDKDFGELAVYERQAHCGIVRLVNVAARAQGQVVLHILAVHGKELLAGAVATAEPGRLRIRPPERRD